MLQQHRPTTQWCSPHAVILIAGTHLKRRKAVLTLVTFPFDEEMNLWTNVSFTFAHPLWLNTHTGFIYSLRRHADNTCQETGWWPHPFGWIGAGLRCGVLRFRPRFIVIQLFKLKLPRAVQRANGAFQFPLQGFYIRTPLTNQNSSRLQNWFLIGLASSPSAALEPPMYSTLWGSLLYMTHGFHLVMILWGTKLIIHRFNYAKTLFIIFLIKFMRKTTI